MRSEEIAMPPNGGSSANFNIEKQSEIHNHAATAISPEAHLKARLWAAHHDVSLSAVISTLLEGCPTIQRRQAPPSESTSNGQTRTPPPPPPQ